ncbi:MAG: hypothetical protein IPL33_06475 [Sphingobacteriales bacterium]|nr:hypothetical protein [Sphingobacteriales bacterium]
MPPKPIQSVYYSKLVLQTLNNPYIKIYDRDGVETYMSQAERNNWIYAKAETICSRLSHPIFQLLFQPLRYIYRPQPTIERCIIATIQRPTSQIGA